MIQQQQRRQSSDTGHPKADMMSPDSSSRASSPSSSSSTPDVITPVMNNPDRFQNLVTPQLPPPPAMTPTQPVRQASNLDGRRATSINGQGITDVRKNLATDQKTPAEYTLHILFTQFVRHAERKLNVCLNNFSLETEAPIIDLLSEGADAEFDKIIESLGHIARRKPKPVIDSVMFWRKSKSEVSMLAASAVEKNLKNLRAEQKRLNSNESPSTSLVRADSAGTILSYKQGQQQQQQQPAPPKRLYRQASLSFIRGHRNNSSKTTLSTAKSTSSPQEYTAPPPTNDIIRSLEKKLEESRITAIQGERKSLISIFILCRVLIEVVRQTPTDVLGDDLGDKLEEIIYTQLKTTNPLLMGESMIRSSNWNLFAELLGHMSEKRFLNVSDRFIADLEKVPPIVQNGLENYMKNDQNIPLETIFNESGDNSIIEESLSLLIHGMRYLKLKHYPLEEFEESVDFLQSIGKFFSKSRNENLIIAYSEVLSQLLLPLGGVITAEVNHPQWREAIKTIYTKALAMLKHEPEIYWECGLNLQTMVLSVSPTEIFLENWISIIDSNVDVLKPKVPVEDKIIFITCFARLLWAYLYRCTESLNTTHRTLDNLFKTLFFSSSNRKQQWLTSDPALIEILVYLIRIVGYSSINYTLERVLLPLIKQGYSGPTLENISQPYLILAIKSYVCILNDFEARRRPRFPSDDLIRDLQQEQYTQNPSTLNMFNNQQPVFQKDTSNAAISEEISNVFQRAFSLLDQTVGAPTWQSDEESLNGPANYSGATSPSPVSMKSSFSSFLHGKEYQTQVSKGANVELFATLIESSPYMNINMGSKKLIEILVRNAVHNDHRVSSAAIASLKVLIVRRNPKILITVFARYAFQLDDSPKQTYNIDFLTSAEYLKLLKIYVELLLCWLDSLRFRLDALTALREDNSALPVNGHALQTAAANGNDLTRTESNKIGDELELKNIVTIIEEVEGNGLFFLCSQDFGVRGLGLQTLKIISQFDDVIYDISAMQNRISQGDAPKGPVGMTKKHGRSPSKFVAEFGTRLIHVLEGVDFFEMMSPLESEISYPEKTRLKELRLRRKKNVLTYLAKSDYGIDSTLWFKAFPKILKIIFEKCGIPVALCRSVVCVRLVQMFDTIFNFANKSGAQRTTAQGPYHQPSNSASSFFSSFNSAALTYADDQPKSAGAQSKLTYKHHSPTEIIVEQWRVYLIFACSTLTSTNDQKLHIPSPSISSTNSAGGFTKSHMRKRSQQVFTVQHQRITSATSIFKMVIPLLGTSQLVVRDAVVISLSSININIFRSFIESVIPIMESWMNESRQKDQWNNKVKIEVARILNNVTANFLQNETVHSDDWILANLLTIIKYLKTFLSTPQVQVNPEFQGLRRYFAGILESVVSGVLKSDDPEKWFPFEARISCFTFLEEWCGYGKFASVTEERYNFMSKRILSTKDSISLSATVELEKSALKYSAISCMATICSNPITKTVEEDHNSVVMSFDEKGLLEWIHALFLSTDEKLFATAKRALSNILISNTKNKEIFLDVINQCYLTYEHPKALEGYFLTLTDSLLKLKQLPVEGYRILTLCFFAVGSANYNIRVAASKLLQFAEKLLYTTASTALLTERICSKSKPIFKSSAFHVAAIFAKDVQIISELSRLFHIVGPDSRRDILSALLPFFNMVELKIIEASAPDEVTQMVLYNLFEITIKYSDTMQNEVEGLWVALGNGNNNSNVKPIVDFITNNCLQSRNPHFVQYSRQIIVYLSNTPSGASLASELIAYLEPKHMVPPQQIQPIVLVEAVNMPYIADIWDSLAYSGKEAVFSLGQLSIIFLSDLLISPPEVVKTKLPLLLHVTFVLLDHYLPLVQNVAAESLMHIVHSLSGGEAKALGIIDILRERDPKSFWVYDDLNRDKNGARTPATMDALIRDSLSVLSSKIPGLQEDWSRVSLSWATTCAVRHIACRSFQVFRSLLSFLDQSMLRDMLHRLSNTVSDETPDIQGFAMQILMTLNAVTAELDSAQLIDFPQLFWSSVACLSSVHEQEYLEVLSTLSKFVSKIDLDSEVTVSCLTTTFPPKWEGKFGGLQQIVMIGLRSSNSWEHSLKLLDRLNKLHDSQIIGFGDARLLLALLSNLPRYLLALQTNVYTDDVIDSAETICTMVDRIQVEADGSNDRSALKRILQSFIKNRFRTKADFMNEVVNKIVKYFFPEFEAQTLVFLLGLLSNNLKWVKVETMELLEKVFPWVDLQREEFIGVGADLISPLLRLLLTDYAEQALKVLDEAVSISGSQLDKDVLRMSLGNKTIRKEYEKTATLFGIPDESGWAIPMPAVTAATTRNNVHSVFSTCTTTANNPETDAQTNAINVEFHRDEYFYAPSAGEMGDTLSVVESHQQQAAQQQDPSLSHIYAALVNLDSFFAEEGEEKFAPNHPGVSHQYSSSIDTRESNPEPVIPFESAPQVYDKKVSAILNRSLARTPSNTSFKTSLADSFGTTPTTITEQYINRDSSNHSLSQRGSYMSFRSNRNSAKRSMVERSTSSLLIHSATDLSKPDEKPLHRSPPLPSSVSKDFDSPTLLSDQQPQFVQASQTSQEGSFRFDGFLRTSNKTRRKSGRAYNSGTGNSNANSTSNGNNNINPNGNSSANNSSNAGNVNSNSNSNNGSSSPNGQMNIGNGQMNSASGASNGTLNDVATGSNTTTGQQSGANTARSKDRSSVFSRGNKKNSPKYPQGREQF